MGTKKGDGKTIAPGVHHTLATNTSYPPPQSHEIQIVLLPADAFAEALQYHTPHVRFNYLISITARSYVYDFRAKEADK